MSRKGYCGLLLIFGLGLAPLTAGAQLNTQALVTGDPSLSPTSSYGDILAFTGKFKYQCTLASGCTPSNASGTMAFFDGATSLGTGTAVASNGVSYFSTGLLEVGSHPISVVYSGDARYLGSTSAAYTQTVQKAQILPCISSTCMADGKSVAPGDYVPLTVILQAGSLDSNTGLATVKNYSGIPKGEIALYVGTKRISYSMPVGKLPPNAYGAVFYGARLTPDTTVAGTYPITAVYSGDANNLPGTSAPWTLTVAGPCPYPTVVSVAISGPTVLDPVLDTTTTPPRYTYPGAHYTAIPTWSDGSTTTPGYPRLASGRQYASIDYGILWIKPLPSTVQTLTLVAEIFDRCGNPSVKAPPLVVTLNPPPQPTNMSSSASLQSGWNQLGNGSNAPIDVAATFGSSADVTAVWKWVAKTGKWAFFAPSLSGQALSDYAASRGYDVLTSIDEGEGFWVNAVQPFTASVPSGTALPASSFQGALASGWSLIAVGETQTPREFNLALASSSASPSGPTPPVLTSLWLWDNAQSAWYFYAPSLDGQGGNALASYASSKGYLDFATAGKTLGAGVGFWVNMQ